MKAVGIDIGSASIKVAELNQTTKALTVTSFQEHVFSQNPGADHGLEIAEFLHNLMERYRDDVWQIVIGLRQDSVAVRNKIFPFNDRLKILKSLPFELEEDFPFSPENAIYDAKIIQVTGTSAEVLACATPKNRVAEILQKARDYGVDPSILSVEGIAFANCWEKWNSPPHMQATTQIELEGDARPRKNIHLILNMGHSRTLVCAMENDTLVGLRSIFWGGKNLAEHIAKKYEISFVEALKVVQTRAFILLSQENSAYDQIVFSQTITESLRDLTRDLQMTMLEFQSEFNGHVNSISICGGTSQIQNLGPFLTQQLELPVNMMRILSQRFQASFPFDNQIDIKCGVALGLAIEGLKKPRNPALNFMKAEFAKQNKKLQIFWSNWGESIKLAAVAFLLFVVYAVIRDQLAASLADRSADALKTQAKAIAHLSAKQANDANVQKFVRDQRKRAQDIKLLQNVAGMNSALDILRKISDAAPGKNSLSLKVKRIGIHENRVEIEGTVAKPQEMSLLQQSLAPLSMNGRVDKISPTVGADNGTVVFAYGLNVDRGLTQKK